jgi:aryl-alcohol dehydrogenase-like predicted oxidoreductase
MFAHMHCRYLEENVGALAVKLSPEDMQELEAAFPQDKVCVTGCV